MTKGLSLTDQLAHPWSQDFALEPAEIGTIRPRSPYFHDLAWLEENKSGLSLGLHREALNHPTTELELSRLRSAFLMANLGETEALATWLDGPGKEPLKVGDRQVSLSLDKDAAVYSVSKSRGRFWPF